MILNVEMYFLQGIISTTDSEPAPTKRCESISQTGWSIRWALSISLPTLFSLSPWYTRLPLRRNLSLQSSLSRNIETNNEILSWCPQCRTPSLLPSGCLNCNFSYERRQQHRDNMSRVGNWVDRLEPVYDQFGLPMRFHRSGPYKGGKPPHGGSIY